MFKACNHHLHNMLKACSKMFGMDKRKWSNKDCKRRKTFAQY